MARRARRRRRRHVRSRQRKSRHAVIECRRRPPRRRMARRAVGCRKRRSRRRVHRSIRLLPGRQMALRIPAIRRRDRQIIIVVDVAQRAGHIRVPRRQRKSRRAVVEYGRRPAHRIVAGRAVRRRKRRPRRWMHRIRGRLPGRQMASRIPAIVRRDRQIIIVVDVAQRAGHIRVPVRQQKSRRAVVELGVRPIIKRVARRAVRRRKCRSRRRVHRIRRRLPIRQVARRARRRQPYVSSHRRVLMALLAFHHRVRPQQRKPVEVLRNRLHRYLPAQHRVALRTVRPELRPVYVRVTIRALLPDIRKHRLQMASRARYFLVHPPQRIPRAVMIEFRNGPYRRPTRIRVAILARNRQRPVRTLPRLPLPRRRHPHRQRNHRQHHPPKNLCHSVNNCPLTLYLTPTLTQTKRVSNIE